MKREHARQYLMDLFAPPEPEPEPELYYLNLADRQASLIPRRDRDRAQIATLAHLIAPVTTVTLPGPIPWDFTWYHSGAGGAIFAIEGPPQRLYASCYACWNPSVSAEPSWDGKALYGPLPLPWLAVEHGLVFARLPPDAQHELVTLERCLFWAIRQLPPHPPTR